MWQDWLLSPAALAVLGLFIGSFLNAVIHRLPLMMARQWWAEVAGYLQDADSHRQVFGQALPEDQGAVAQTQDILDVRRVGSHILS